jgi:predicted DNA-binding antitoxin AbrB/MazE fold protein
MENMEIEAVCERGTLKLPRELPLREGQAVARRGQAAPAKLPRD